MARWRGRSWFELFDLENRRGQFCKLLGGQTVRLAGNGGGFRTFGHIEQLGSRGDRDDRRLAKPFLHLGPVHMDIRTNPADDNYLDRAFVKSQVGQIGDQGFGMGDRIGDRLDHDQNLVAICDQFLG